MPILGRTVRGRCPEATDARTQQMSHTMSVPHRRAHGTRVPDRCGAGGEPAPDGRDGGDGRDGCDGCRMPEGGGDERLEEHQRGLFHDCPRHRPHGDCRMAGGARRCRSCRGSRSIRRPAGAPGGPRRPGWGAGHRHRLHALPQHHRRVRSGRLPRGPRDRAAPPGLHPLECHGHGGAGQSHQPRHRWPPGHLCLCCFADRCRPQPLLRWPPRVSGQRPGLLPGALRTGYLCPGLPGRTPHRSRPGCLPPRGRRWRTPELPPSAHHVGFLGVLHCLDGARAAGRHPPGPGKSLHGGTRPAPPWHRNCLVLRRRW